MSPAVRRTRPRASASPVISNGRSLLRASRPEPVSIRIPSFPAGRSRLFRRPYPGRGAKVISTSISPRLHSTSRRISRSGSKSHFFSSSEATGMRSVRTMSPVPVSNRVWSTLVCLRYCRSVLNGAAGAIRQRPAAGSRMAPNRDGLSNRGQHSQSIEPSRPTRAALRPSPIAA